MRNRISFILLGLIVVLLLGPDFSTWLQQGGLQFGQPFSYLEVRGLLSSKGSGATIGVMPNYLLIDLLLGVVSFLLYMLWMFLRKKNV